MGLILTLTLHMLYTKHSTVIIRIFVYFQIDDREFTVEINAYLIVKWIDKRILINIPDVSKQKSLIHTFFLNANKNVITVDKDTYYTNQ